MRIIVKNAKFQVYGLDDVSAILNRISDNYGGATSIDAVRALLVALGADGSNDIWGKIKALYLPVLSVPTDGANALYDVISEDGYPGENYTIETKRGIRPTTLGTNIGRDATYPAGMTSAGISLFAVATLSSAQSLSGSSGVFTAVGDLKLTWRLSTIDVDSGRDSSQVQIANATGFTKPVPVAVSCIENGERTVVAPGGTNHNTLAASTLLDLYLSGSNAWCATAILGVCEGLTATEASAVVSALSTFITDFGVLC